MKHVSSIQLVMSAAALLWGATHAPAAETLVVAEEERYTLDDKTLSGLTPIPNFPPEGPLALFSKGKDGSTLVQLLDINTGKLRQAGTMDNPDLDPELSMDGQSILLHTVNKFSSGGTEFTTARILLLNPNTGEKRFEENAPSYGSFSAYIVKQGYPAPGLLKLIKNGGTLYVDTRTGRAWNWTPPAEAADNLKSEPVAIAPDRGLVARLSMPEHRICAGNICLFNVKTGAVTVLPNSRGFDQLAFSPAGKLLAAAEQSSTKVWDLRTLKVIHEEPDFGGKITFSPDGSTIALAKDTSLRFIFPERTIPAVTIDSSYNPAIAFTADSGLAAVQNKETVIILNTRTAKITAEVPDKWHGELRFTGDGRILAIGNELWDTAAWKLLAVMPDPWIGLSSDGKHIATRDFNGQEQGHPITLWRIGTMREVLSRYLEQQVNKWQKKGPFEKTSDYLARVNDASRSEFIKSCQKTFIERYAKAITLHSRQAVYDPDNETFKIEFRENIPAVYLKVPANEAQKFMEAAEKDKLSFRKPQWSITSDFSFILRSAQVHTAEYSATDKTYEYDSGSTAEFNVVDLKLNFAKPEISAPQGEPVAKPQETRSTVAVGEPGLDTPPFSRKADPQKFALVIGIENYRSAPPAKYAERDASAMRAYLRALGTPDRNIYFISGANATKSAIVGRLEELLPKNLGKNSSLFVYYSGHGSQDEKGNGYLVPWDGELNMLASTAIPLKQFYTDIRNLPAGKIIVAMDACFSGSGARSAMPDGARPLVVLRDEKDALPGNMALMTSAAAAEISGAQDAAAHGLFTYYLLKQLGARVKTDNSLKVGDFFIGVSEAVADEAHRQNREQTPQLKGNTGLPLF